MLCEEWGVVYFMSLWSGIFRGMWLNVCGCRILEGVLVRNGCVLG